MIMNRLDGETLGPRIVRDEAFAAIRPSLAFECGRILGKLHSIDPATVPGAPEVDALDDLPTAFDQMKAVSPTFELVFR
jgi:aminoglycoside phosphotransferase (APT) family kinase protein